MQCPPHLNHDYGRSVHSTMPTRPLIVAAGATLALAVAIRAMDTEPAAEPAPEPAPQTEAPAQPPAPEPAEGPFDRLLLDHATKYREWKRVSDLAYFAPTLCDTPPIADTLHSKSDDAETHGSKLYHLYVSNQATYLHVNDTIAQSSYTRTTASDFNGTHVKELALVKQTWKPLRVDESVDGPAVQDNNDDRNWSYRFARGDDGHWYKPGEQADLFIMAKLDPETPNTDNGWVYGVVSSDGQRVLAASAIESCMKCHVKAPVDRLFGLPWAQAERTQREQLEQEKAAGPAENR